LPEVAGGLTYVCRTPPINRLNRNEFRAYDIHRLAVNPAHRTLPWRLTTTGRRSVDGAHGSETHAVTATFHSSTGDRLAWLPAVPALLVSAAPGGRVAAKANLSGRAALSAFFLEELLLPEPLSRPDGLDRDRRDRPFSA
jgi:hypothetical protein